MSSPNPERDERVTTNSDKGRLSNHMARLGAGLLLLKEKMDAPIRRPLSYADRVAFEFEGEQYVIISADLLDSHPAETFAGPCVGCGHNNYDTDQKECKQRWMEGSYSVVCGCPCAKHNSLANAATRMRDRCVEKVREMIEVWAAPDSDLGDEVSGFRIDAANDIIEVLESLTLRKCTLCGHADGLREPEGHCVVCGCNCQF